MEKQRVKKYVDVNLDVAQDGSITVKSVKWEDRDEGIKVFNVDACGTPRRMASMKCGGTGMCYPIRIGGKSTLIWDEEGKWFVEGVAE